jgi:hypothetical protein
MKNFDLTLMNVQELSTLEMKDTDGGIIVLLIVAAAALLLGSSCVPNVQIRPEVNPIQETKPPADSTAVKNA